MENSENRNNLRSFLKRRSVKILASVILLIVVVLLALPVGLRIYLEKWLQENGADTASIEKVRFSPITGVVGLDGVKVEKDGETVFSDSTIYLNLGLTNLLSRQALLQQVTLENIIIDIEKNSDGSFRIASYTIAGKSGEPEVESVDTVEVKEGTPWTVFADVVDLKNIRVHYEQPDLKLNLEIESAIIEKFNTDPDLHEGSLKLKGFLNGSEIDIDLPKLHIVPAVDIDGQITVRDFKLQEFADFLGDILNPFTGIANVDGKVKFAMPGSDQIDIRYDGSLSLGEVGIGGEGWSTAGTITYDGSASFGMQSGDMEVVVEGDLEAKDAAFDMPEPLIDIDNPDILIAGKTVVKIGESVVVETGAGLKLAPTTYQADVFKTGAGDTSWAGEIQLDTGTASRGLDLNVQGKLSIAEPFFNLDMDSGLMEVGNELISYEGKVKYTLGAGENKGSHILTDGVLLGQQIYYRLPDTVDFSQQQLKLAGKTEVKIESGVDVSYGGELSLGGTGFGTTGMKIAEEMTSWKGDIGYSLKKDSQRISLSGEMNMSGTDFTLDEAELKIHQDNLSITPDFGLTLAAKPSFEGKAGLEVAGLAVSQKSIPLLSLDRIGVVDLKGDGAGGVVAASLDVEKITLPSSETIPVGVDVPSISLKDIKSADLMSGVAAALVIEKPTVTEKEGKKTLAGLDQITVTNISLSKDIAASVEQVEFEGGRFLADKEDKPMVTLKQLLAKKLEYSSADGLVLDKITLDGITADILKEKKEPGEEKESVQKEEGKEVEVAEESTGSAGMPLRINSIEVTGDSTVKFADTSLSRTFMTLFNLESLNVRDIDLNSPEQPFSYELKGNFEKYTPLEVTGECAPLAENLLLKQKLVLRNYSMLRVSPYVVQAIGTFFPSGMMDLHSSLDIADGSIDMKNNLVLKDLVTEGVKGDLASELDNQLPVPLNLALTMLEDSEGLIDLDVPIKGKLSDVNIGTADLIWTPLSNAITVAVTPYLAYTALGPAGALTYLGAKIGGGMLKTNLPVLEFEKVQTELTEEHLKKLDKAGKKIKKDLDKNGVDDPEYAYSICSKVSFTELSSVSSNDEENQEVLRNEAIRIELFKLGEARSLAVKDYLVKNFDIEESRLMICNPGLNFDRKAKPVVEFRK